MNHPASKLSDRGALIEQLRSILGDRASTSSSVLEQHGRGESWHPVQAPDLVCFAQSNAEVATIVKLCAASATPVIAYGTGTSLEGQVQAVNGVNEKIEGFFRLCKARRLSGRQGVILPSANVQDLMVDPEVVEACAWKRLLD